MLAKSQALPQALVLEEPFPIWLIEHPHTGDSSPPFNDYRFLAGLRRDLVNCAFRGLTVARLDNVLRSGIDVEPTHSVIFVDMFSKAWEYGGWPKLILALQWQGLSHTYREVSADIDQLELQRLESTFQTKLTSKDGKKLWFSRLKHDDPRIATEYETAYARWIPDDPFKVIAGALIFGEREEVMAALPASMRMAIADHVGARSVP